MASQVSICNQALAALGANLIISLDDDSVEARICKAHYDDVRDAVLEAYDWTFATRWLKLPKLANPPVGQYANAFELPPNVLRIIFVGTSVDHLVDDWNREGMNIVMDQDSCMCQVILRELDPSKYSPMFVQALVARLAAEIAVAITNSADIMANYMRIYEDKVEAAAARDGMQGKSRRYRSSWLKAARGGGDTTMGPLV